VYTVIAAGSGRSPNYHPGSAVRPRDWSAVVITWQQWFVDISWSEVIKLVLVLGLGFALGLDLRLRYDTVGIIICWYSAIGSRKCIGLLDGKINMYAVITVMQVPSSHIINYFNAMLLSSWLYSICTILHRQVIVVEYIRTSENSWDIHCNPKNLTHVISSNSSQMLTDLQSSVTVGKSRKFATKRCNTPWTIKKRHVCFQISNKIHILS